VPLIFTLWGDPRGNVSLDLQFIKTGEPVFIERIAIPVCGLVWKWQRDRKAFTEVTEPKSRMSANSIIPAWALILSCSAGLVNFGYRWYNERSRKREVHYETFYDAGAACTSGCSLCYHVSRS